MARDSQDREDLLRDAIAFKSRIQLIIPALSAAAAVNKTGFSQTDPAIIFVGYRASGAISFYFDQDPVYHFNGQGQLRRAFVDDTLIKAEAGQLIGWTRQPHTETEVVMLRDELPANRQQAFCKTALSQLRQLQQTLLSGKYKIEGQVQPTDSNEDILDRIAAFLAALNAIEIAASPRVSG